MDAEFMAGILCLVSVFMVLWNILLRLQIDELKRKATALEEYYKAKTKLESI